MRDRLFAPIEYDASTNAYVYSEAAGPPTAPKDAIQDPRHVDRRQWAYAMLTLINVLGKVDPGMLMPYVGPLKMVLKNILCERRFPMRGFHKKVAVSIPNLKAGDRAVVQSVRRTG